MSQGPLSGSGRKTDRRSGSEVRRVGFVDKVELDVSTFEASRERKKLGLVRNGQDDSMGSGFGGTGLTGSVNDLTSSKSNGKITSDDDVVVDRRRAPGRIRTGRLTVRAELALGDLGARNALRVKLGSS